MRAGTRERLTGACDTLIGIAAVLIIVAVHWPWAHATLTPPDQGLINVVSFPWWNRPQLFDGTTLVMTMSYGARVAAAAALTSLISSIASPGPPAMMPNRQRGSSQETAAD